jgi:hypothetical protein
LEICKVAQKEILRKKNSLRFEWQGQVFGLIDFFAAKVKFYFLISIRISFRRVQVCSDRSHIDIPLPSPMNI